MSKDLRFIFADTKEDKKLKALIQQGYVFFERYDLNTFQVTGMHPIFTRQFEVIVTTPDGMKYQKICSGAARNDEKRYITLAVLSAAWKHYEDAEKLRQYELFISSVCDHQPVLKEWHEASYATTLYIALQAAVHGAQVALRFRAKVK